MKLRDILLIIQNLEKYNLNFKDLSIIELGEQELKLWEHHLNNEYIKKWLYTNPRKWPTRPPSNRLGFFSKDFFNYYFKKCTSVDFECHCNQSLKIDLEKDVFKQNINEPFDILTNLGTTEHVGQITTTTRNPQYHAFKNVHNLVKKGGFFFHNIPYAKDKNHLLMHGAYCYNETFIKQLSEKNNYTILKNELYMGEERPNFLDAFLIKNDDNEFMSEEEFDKLEGLFETPLRKK